MEVAALVAAIIAAGISGWALAYTRRADAREERRVQREDAEALARKAARPGAEHIGQHDANGRRLYRFRVTNIGRETASDTRAYLIDRAGEPVGVLVDTHGGDVADQPDKPLPRVFTPGSSTELEMSVKEEALKRGPLFLRFEWTDGTGRRDKTSNVEAPTGGATR